MSIPHVKRRGLESFIHNHGSKHLTGIPFIECECTTINCSHRPSRRAVRGSTSPPGRADASPPGPGPSHDGAPRIAAGALLSLMVGVLLIGLMPNVEGQDASDWSAPSSIPTDFNVVSRVYTDFSGENVGVAWAHTGNTRTGFTFYDSITDTWTVENSDVTAGVNGVPFDVVSMGGTEWGMGIHDAGTSVAKFYHSTDNGETWSLDESFGTAMSIQSDIIYAGGNTVAIAYHQGTSILFTQSTNDGLTWTATPDVISDNKGGPGVAGTNAISATSTAIITLETGGYGVYFISTVDNALYFVSSTDGGFWTVAYTTDGGATKNPVTTSGCAGITPSGVSAVRTNTQTTWAFYRTNGGKQYLCVNNTPVPSATPPNTLVGHDKLALAGNNGGFLVAGIDSVTFDALIYYAPTNTYSLSNTIIDPNSSTTMDLVMTGSLGYFIYVDNSAGGQLKEVHASVFTSDIPSTQIAVVGLTGYSMDALGQNIIVRVETPDEIHTYNPNNLAAGAIATVNLPNCNRFDGVVSTALQEGIVWNTYADCRPDGQIDALRIRDDALAVPVFPNDCFGEANADVENGADLEGDIDVPNNMEEIGTLSDMSYDFEECVNPPGPAHASFASWTFSSSSNGWIAAFGVVYGEDGAAIQERGSKEEHAPELDISAFPQVDNFCSWRGLDGNDYIGGVSSNGAVGVYQVIRDVSVDAVTGIDEDADSSSIDFTFIQKFRNSGPPYTGSSSIACAENLVAIQTPTEVRILTNITTTPALLFTIPNIPVVTRTLAFSQSAEFLFVHKGTEIVPYRIDIQNTTGSFPVPSGIWQGMESDNSASKLAVFTSTFLTVYQTAEITCEIDNSCEAEGSIGDDGTGGPTTTTTGGPGGLNFGPNIEDNVYFWVIFWILIVVIGLALLSWGSRAGFSGLVYIIGVAMVYIAAILLNNYDGGTTNVSPWPVAAMSAISIGLAITWWARR